MYEKLFLASSLAIIVAACDKHDESVLINMPIVQETSGLGANEIFKTIAGDRVFFAFDSADLSKGALGVLKKQAVWLLDHPNLNFIIEGHADERGTSQYNLELGMRRAAAVRKYFLDQGISRRRITLISFGKDCPEDLGHNTQAWNKNRRAVIIIN